MRKIAIIFILCLFSCNRSEPEKETTVSFDEVVTQEDEFPIWVWHGFSSDSIGEGDLLRIVKIDGDSVYLEPEKRRNYE